MQKILATLFVAGTFAIFAAWNGCASKKAEQPIEYKEVSVTTTQAKTVESPVNLGASSSGLAR